MVRSIIGHPRGEVEGIQEDYFVEALTKAISPSWVQEALEITGRHSRRKRDLPAAFTLWLIVLMGLFRRVSYSNLLEKLHGGWWTTEQWGSGRCPSSSAVTKARDRIGVEPVRYLFHRVSKESLKKTAGTTFCDRRVLAIDGSTLKTADSDANRREFGKPKGGRGEGAYPQMRLVALVDVGTHIVLDVRFGPYAMGEHALAAQLFEELRPGDLVLLDRNFVSSGFLWDLRQTGADFAVRIKEDMKPRIVQRLSDREAIVEIEIPPRSRRKRPVLPRKWRLRMIEFGLDSNNEIRRLYTSLLDPKELPVGESEDLYRWRWEEEGVLDELKTHLCGCARVNQPVVFRSQTPERVEQELYGILIAFNALRCIMCEAALAIDQCCLLLSFTAALERVRETIRDMMQMRTHLLPERYLCMLDAIGRSAFAKRPGRHNRREVKITTSPYPKKKSKDTSCAA